MNIWCSDGSRSFQGTWALKMGSIVVSHQKLTTTNWKPLSRLIILQLTTWEVVEELNVGHSMVMWHFSQIGKVRKLDKWVPYELARMEKKNHCFEVLSLLILCNNEELFLDQIVMCEDKWTLYDNWQQPAQWLDWEEAPKHFPKPNLYQKRSWSLFDDLLPIRSITAFWIPTKPLHLKSVLSKSMRTENCSTCSRPWSTERACLHPHLTSHQPITPPSRIWTTFCRRKCFHSQQEAENAF